MGFIERWWKAGRYRVENKPDKRWEMKWHSDTNKGIMKEARDWNNLCKLYAVFVLFLSFKGVNIPLVIRETPFQWQFVGQMRPSHRSPTLRLRPLPGGTCLQFLDSFSDIPANLHTASIPWSELGELHMSKDAAVSYNRPILLQGSFPFMTMYGLSHFNYPKCGDLI